MPISVVGTKKIAMVSSTSSAIVDAVIAKFDIASRPDRDDELVLDVRDFDGEEMSELFESLGVEHASEEAETLSEADFLFIYIE